MLLAYYTPLSTPVDIVYNEFIYRRKSLSITVENTEVFNKANERRNSYLQIHSLYLLIQNFLKLSI